MTLPTIHLNGTSASSLLEQNRAAMDAVQAAIEAVAAAAPNARDFYPQGEPAIDQALAEHRARLDSLRQVFAELQELSVHCFKHVR